MSEINRDHIEFLARHIAARAAGSDPDHMVLPSWLVPIKLPVVGGYAVSAQGQSAPVPLWRCYERLAQALLEAGIVKI
jgi:hypothetical protein